MRIRLPILLIVLILAACSAASPSAQNPTPTSEQKSEQNIQQKTEQASQQQPTYRTLTIDAFADILATKGDQYTVVNVHIPYEGELEGTDLKIPYNDVNALMAALPDKNAPIILYCRSGRMSEIAAKALIDKGYTQVWDVPGGMIKWEESGRKVITK